MSANHIEVRCPQCGCALVVQRAAPADAQLRVACPRCGAEGRIGAQVMQPLVLVDESPLSLAA